MLRYLPKLAVGVTAAIGVYLAVAVTFANSVAGQAPQLALGVWPGHATAQARLAERLFQDNPSPQAIDDAAALSALALRRDPTLADAARNLGLWAGIHGNAAQAARMMEYSAFVSRRDVPTQLWLLEQHVQRNDVEGALHYYAVVLQIEPQMRETLYQVLASAVGHPDLIRPIARMAKGGDVWRNAFLTYVVGNATDLHGAGSLLFTLRQMGVEIAPSLPQELIRRMLDQRDVLSAARVYSLVDPRWRASDPASQIDGGFDIADGVPPFGWTLDPNYASRDIRPGTVGNAALRVVETMSASQVFARRKLLIPAGSLRLEGMYFNEEAADGGTLHVSLRCGDDRVESEFDVALRGSGRFAGRLSATPCGEHWLAFRIDPSSASNGQVIWLDDLRLGP